MAPQVPRFSPLRVVTQRLSSTPAKHMAHVAPCLAASIIDCRDIISSSTNHGGGKDASETSVLVHKLKSQLSALLQEKAVEARWAAVVLIKATVEVGGWEVLRGSGAWVRGLLGLLGRPDPITTKKLCVITITKIFLLTHEYQTLVREITTPHLPSLINTCLTTVAPKSASPRGHQASAKMELLPTILDAFCHLLPRHPTLFRPFAAQLQALLLPLIAPTPSSQLPLHDPPLSSLGLSPVSADMQDSAQSLFALLHCCAPKNTSGDEWRKAIRTTIADIHHTANKIFRAVIEDWEATVGTSYQAPESRNLGEQISDLNEDLLGLPSWQGISAGVERLCGLLAVIKAFIATTTSSMVSLPLGPLMDMLARIFSLVVPSKQASADRYGGPRLNPEIGRDEREGLWTGLPRIHVAALNVLSALAARLDCSFTPFAQGALDQIAWVFAAERFNCHIRTHTYLLVAQVLRLTGPSLTRASVLSLAEVVRGCCDDLLPLPAASVTAGTASTSKKGNEQTKGASSIDADAFLPSSVTKTQPDTLSGGTYFAASVLLPLFLTEMAPQSLPYPLRVQVDRTAVLTRHKEAMIASVLNPPSDGKGTRRSKSIMPLLVRSFGADLEVEGLLRPRMPIIQVGKLIDGETDSAEGDDDDYIPHNQRFENRYSGNTAGIREDNSPPQPPKLTEPAAGPSDPTNLDQGANTAASIVEDVMDLTSEKVPPALSFDTEYSSSSNKRHREIAEADHTLATSGQLVPATVKNHDAPNLKRVRLEGETTSLSSAQVSDVAIGVTQRQISSAAESTRSDAISRGVPASASSTTPALGGASDDSDDDNEIPPLVMDSDTEEGEEEEEGEGV